ncbi:MAG: 50S ribosomal protein L13 [Acidobacteria bacterium RBG_16_68_9]|nr:MAG: 50S ribosomal protein L13 [Acidobacteria bacterium RBG_16_68_9]
MKTTSMLTREAALAGRRWFLIDAEEQVLGRVASEAAMLLRGKRNPGFTPHVDCGDFVIVINAERVRVTGKKRQEKVYYRHSGYPGGVRSRTAGERLALHADRVVREAVEGMLPKNRLGRRLATKLKVYVGAVHPHAAQQPQAITVPGAIHA